MIMFRGSYTNRSDPASCYKSCGCPYRTLWGWINESDENRQRYNKLKEEQDEMIRVKIDEFINSMMKGDIQVETEITKNGLIQYRIRINILKKQDGKTLFWSKSNSRK